MPRRSNHERARRLWRDTLSLLASRRLHVLDARAIMIPQPGTRDRRDLRLVLAGLMAPLGLMFCAALLVVRQNGKPVWKLVGDPTAVLHANPLLGFFSNLGILGWCAGASVALFAAAVLVARQADRAIVRFYHIAGAFTALLMVDDFFLIHDDLAWRYLRLPQNTVYAIYGVFFAAFVVRCRRELLARNPALFALGVGLLAFMAGIDAVASDYSKYIGLAMCGSKLLGIFIWSAWLVLNARNDLAGAGPGASRWDAHPTRATARMARTVNFCNCCARACVFRPHRTPIPCHP